jgi:hypothetical protein
MSALENPGAFKALGLPRSLFRDVDTCWRCGTEHIATPHSPACDCRCRSCDARMHLATRTGSAEQ